MKITNALSLPAPFVSLAEGDEYPVAANEYRVTSLLKGTRETILERRHGAEITRDVSDMVWLLFGTAVHGILEQHQEGGSQLKEERIKVPFEEYVLSGKFDLYDDETKIVTDYKTASVWKIIFGDFSDWRRQTLIYSWIDGEDSDNVLPPCSFLETASVEDEGDSLCDYVLEPLLSKTFIYDNYASQKGKGTHFGLDRLKVFMQRYYRQFGADGWVLKCDITKYFYRINHGVLKTQLRRLITDPDVLWLLDMIVDSTEGTGIPIGNHTSQWFAVLYLSGLDHMIKERLGIKLYGRYMDDFYLIHPDKDYLIYCLDEIKKFLVPLGLELNHKTAIFPLSQGIDFLGFRTYMTDSGKVVRKIRRDSKNRIRRKLKKFRHLLDEGQITFETVVQSYSSLTGHAEHGNSHHLIRQTDELFYTLFKKEMEEYHAETNVDVTRWRGREVGQHEV
ncbi:RNA-directed DNA polymerase [Oscillibacter sp.]|uniref:RNA-directed DNA polymerase n=1 Tax=Oscillibacter sp. TaxID=1945593 RepID=UPI00261CA474|nr:RNA-directed DNA polymerase [Oscillibacter sp.]MDD3347518.1 RNA-directed DNA polymerase [Oscillibacter sp.]